MADPNNVNDIRDVLERLIESRPFDPETLNEIAGGGHIAYDPNAAGASFDVSAAIAFLEKAVPIISGMLGIANTIYTRYQGSKPPTAEEIADAIVARTIPEKDILRIAAAVSEKVAKTAQ